MNLYCACAELLKIGVFLNVEGNHAIKRHSADATPIIDVSHGNNA